MLYGDRTRAGVITGERLLRDDHFEFRGSSPRPAGLPPDLSRLSDSSAAPARPHPDAESRDKPNTP
jgi:hypothetical protein